MSSAKNDPKPSTNPPSLTLSPNWISSICLIDPSSIVTGVPAKKHLLQPLLHGGAGFLIVVDIKSFFFLILEISENTVLDSSISSFSNIGSLVEVIVSCSIDESPCAWNVAVAIVV